MRNHSRHEAEKQTMNINHKTESTCKRDSSKTKPTKFFQIIENKGRDKHPSGLNHKNQQDTRTALRKFTKDENLTAIESQALSNCLPEPQVGNKPNKNIFFHFPV